MTWWIVTAVGLYCFITGVVFTLNLDVERWRVVQSAVIAVSWLPTLVVLGIVLLVTTIVELLWMMVKYKPKYAEHLEAKVKRLQAWERLAIALWRIATPDAGDDIARRALVEFLAGVDTQIEAEQACCAGDRVVAKTTD